MALVTRYVNTASTAGGDGTTNGQAGATRAYASMGEWEAAEQADLVTATDTHEVLCGVGSGSAADPGAVTVIGWTTNSTYYLTIKANPSDTGGDQSAGASWDSSIYRIGESGDQTGLSVFPAYTRVSNLQIYSGSEFGCQVLVASYGGVNDTCIGTVITGCYLYGTSTGSPASTRDFYGVFLNNTSSNSKRFVNNIVHMQSSYTGTLDVVIGIIAESADAVIRNNTVIIDFACSAVDPDSGCIRIYGASTFNDIENNILYVKNAPSGFPAMEEDTTYAGDYNSTNLASQANLDGANDLDGQTFSFTSETGTGTWSITDSDTGARNKGADFSADGDYAYSTDMIGNTRPNTNGSWDIGAFEEQTADAAGGIVTSAVGLGGGMAGYGDRGGLSGSGGGIVG